MSNKELGRHYENVAPDLAEKLPKMSKDDRPLLSI